MLCTACRTALRATTAGVLVGLAVVGPAAPAAAHTKLATASPVDGGTVAGDLDEVVITMSGPVEASLSTIVLTDPRGGAAPGSTSAEGARVTLALEAPLAPGDWQVAYRVVADDGHPVTGTTSFSVSAVAGAAMDADGTPEPAAPAEAAAPAGAAGPPEPEAPAPADLASDRSSDVTEDGVSAAAPVLALGGVGVVGLAVAAAAVRRARR